MYYEPYQKKKAPRQPRRRRKPFGAWLAELFLKLLALALILALLGAGLLYALPVSLLAVEPDGVDLSLTDGLPADRANILLLGLDSLRESSRRSDAMLIASVGRGEVKLTSVLRDAVVDIPGRGAGKLNSAYAYGGATLVMKTLNENLRLNLIHYVAVDYAALVRVVDALGGVELDVTEAELEQLNALIESHRSSLAALGYTSPPLAQSGEGIRLNGVQALAYARIRKLDSDFMRASRQRKLLGAMLRKLRASLWNPVALVRLLRALGESVDTSLSPLQLLSLGLKVLPAEAPDTLRLPVDGSFTDDGSRLLIEDLPANVAAFQTFVYD